MPPGEPPVSDPRLGGAPSECKPESERRSLCGQPAQHCKASGWMRHSPSDSGGEGGGGFDSARCSRSALRSSRGMVASVPSEPRIRTEEPSNRKRQSPEVKGDREREFLGMLIGVREVEGEPPRDRDRQMEAGGAAGEVEEKAMEVGEREEDLLAVAVDHANAMPLKKEQGESRALKSRGNVHRNSSDACCSSGRVESLNKGALKETRR